MLFKDTCKEQWAINSTTVARHKPAGRSCLSKEVSNDGIVIFRETCTSEMGNEQLTEPGRSSAVAASLQPPETVGGTPTDGAHRQSALYHNLTEPVLSSRSALELSPEMPFSDSEMAVGVVCCRAGRVG